MDVVKDSLSNSTASLMTSLSSLGSLFSRNENTSDNFFSKPDELPRAGADATPREHEIVNTAVALVEKHTRGFYDVVFKEKLNNNQGVDEDGPVIDGKNQGFINREGGVADDIVNFIKPLSLEEKLFYYTFNVMVDKDIKAPDITIRRHIENGANFDFNHAQSVLKDAVAFYQSKKSSPEEQKVEGIKYHSSFGSSKGPRPETGKPIKVTPGLAYHPAFAIPILVLKKPLDPARFDLIKNKFHNIKIHAREQAFQDRSPAEATSFNAIDLPAHTETYKALVEVPVGARSYEGEAGVAIHPKTGNFLVEFENNTVKGAPETTYAVSANSAQEPPFARRENDNDLWLEVFTNPDEAANVWMNRAA